MSFTSLTTPSERAAVLCLLREELRRISYKPGYHFDIDAGELGALTLRVGAVLPDAVVGPPHTVLVAVARGLEPAVFLGPRGDELLREEVYRLVCELEMHEVHEFLKVDGRHFQDPHPELTAVKALAHALVMDPLAITTIDFPSRP